MQQTKTQHLSRDSTSRPETSVALREHPREGRESDAHDPQVIDLVTRARDGERSAWDALIDRYSPLIWSICHRWQLDRTDAEDVGQAVWTHLVEHVDNLRDPAALPGWLATTTQRECYRVLHSRRRPADGQLADAENVPDERAARAEDELLTAERHAAFREAFTDLPASCQRLIALLIADPPMSYAEISTRLGICAGSIGPNRGRCLDRLRRHPAIAALIDAEAPSRDEPPPQLGGET
jgi:RNA polymerase sigma factor (sigma-70 family)